MCTEFPPLNYRCGHRDIYMPLRNDRDDSVRFDIYSGMALLYGVFQPINVIPIEMKQAIASVSDVGSKSETCVCFLSRLQ